MLNVTDTAREQMVSYLQQNGIDKPIRVYMAFG